MQVPRDYRLVKMLQAIDQDWMDEIYLAKEYANFLNFKYDDGKIARPFDFNEAKQAYTELRNIETLYRKYKDLVLADRIEEAIEFSHKALELRNMQVDTLT